MKTDTVSGTDTTVNYCSIIGDGVAGTLRYAFGLGGNNPSDWQPLNPDTVIDLNPANPEQYDAILKINASNLTCASWNQADRLLVAQGREDSLNIANNSWHISLAGAFSMAGLPGLRSITVKGGCEDITIAGSIYQKSTSYWDGNISVDDWIDQTYNPSSHIDFTGLSAEFPLIMVTCLSRTNHARGCSHSLLRSLFRCVYWWLKWAVRKFLRIPVGKSGPSWLP